MLRKKTNGVAGRPRSESILSKAAKKSVDRRAFLRGSGLAIGGLSALAATGGWEQKAIDYARQGTPLAPNLNVVLIELKSREISCNPDEPGLGNILPFLEVK